MKVARGSRATHTPALRMVLSFRVDTQVSCVCVCVCVALSPSKLMMILRDERAKREHSKLERL